MGILFKGSAFFFFLKWLSSTDRLKLRQDVVTVNDRQVCQRKDHRISLYASKSGRTDGRAREAGVVIVVRQTEAKRCMGVMRQVPYQGWVDLGGEARKVELGGRGSTGWLAAGCAWREQLYY